MTNSQVDTHSSIPKILNLRGVDCAVHTWNIPSNTNVTKPKGLAVLYHGFLAHAKYPTVRYVAECLSSSNYSVLSVDLPGHGLSQGQRGYVPSAEALVEYAVSIAELGSRLNERWTDGENDALPLFLVGSSLGGAMALAASQELSKEIAGVILLAPMLALSVSNIERRLLNCLSYLIPTFAVIPSSATSSEKQYSDPVRRKECDDDTLCVSGSKLRIASASSCVDLAHRARCTLSDVTIPFLCMIAKDDQVVDNTGAKELMQHSKSNDKTLKEYNALHGLFCESKPLIDEIEADLLEWINYRAD